jgi:hypothetical protein
MSMHNKTNLSASVSRVKTQTSPNRRNLGYLVTAMLVLFGVATLISAGGF